MSCPSLKMSNGQSIPQLGLGTWLSKPGEVHQAVKDALECGYRHIDSAQAYGNQTEVGSAMREVFAQGNIKREDVFITSKVWNVHHSAGECHKAVGIVLKELGVDYVDLMLIHWPQGYKEGEGMFPKDSNGVMQNSDVDYLETWKALEETVKQGKCKSIGVSNFNHEQMLRLMGNCSIKPVYLQIELHPYYPMNELTAFCKQHSITLTGYSPLANPGHMFRKEGMPDLLTEPVLVEIGARHKKTPAQVVLRWFIQRGLVVIPKSVTKSRIAENFNIFDFELSPEEMQKVNGLESGFRILYLERDVEHPHYPFHIKW